MQLKFWLVYLFEKIQNPRGVFYFPKNHYPCAEAIPTDAPKRDYHSEKG